MQNLDSKLELLAPVGDIQSLKQAVFAGANAVYFGYKNFNARRKADNFENLKEVVDFCHLYNVKAYLTLNTCLKNKELAEVEDIVKEAITAKIDAFIINDLTLLAIIRKYDANAELHASTQMGIHNLYGAKFLKELGFSRIVLSRETTIADIEDIKNNIDIELEYFVQGALCVGFSGSCLISSMMNGNSGNRGLCSQICRQKYRFGEKENYYLSPKDLCLAKKIKVLAEKGIISFKIEGRLRRFEYVANAVSIYRKILDNNFIATDKDIENLKKLFNRGDFTEGYNFDKNKNIIHKELNGHKGVLFGEVINVDRTFVYVKTSLKFDEKDGFKVLIPQGYEVGSVLAKGATIKNNTVAFKYQGQIVKGCLVFRTTDFVYNNSVIKDIKLETEIVINIKSGQKVEIFAKHKNFYANFVGSVVALAENKPIEKTTIEKQLRKTNDTPFEINSLIINLDENSFITISELNLLRREVLKLLKENIINGYNKDIKVVKYNEIPVVDNLATDLVISIESIDEMRKMSNIIYEKQISIIINPTNYNNIDLKSIINYRNKYNNLKFYLNLPIFATNKDISILEKLISAFDGVVANNYYGIYLAKMHEKCLIIGNNLNIFNTNNPLINCSNMFIPSVELSKNEINAFNNSKMRVYSYGYLPLMLFKVCYNKMLNMVDCAYCNKKYSLYLKDNKESFLIKNQSVENCNHILYNPIITDIGTDNNYSYFLDLTVDKGYNIIDDYYNRNRITHSKHTKNHLNRGVN